jgi:hypothetical protein
MMSDVYDLFDGFEDRGWDEDTMAILMARFIRERKLASDFAGYLAEVADEENAEAEEDQEEVNEDE